MEKNVELYWARRMHNKDDVLALFTKYNLNWPYGCDENQTALYVLIMSPDWIINLLANDLEQLAYAWAERGEIYEAVQICNKLGISTEVIYNIAKRALGKDFGNNFEEYVLISKYGTPDEINKSLTSCPEARDNWVSHGYGKVRECVQGIFESFEEIYPGGLRTKGVGKELYATHDLIDRYDAIVGIAQAGVAVPRIASVLEHENTGIVEYHRRWKSKRPRWIRAPEHKASRLLICDNDAVTGKTLANVVPYVLRKTEASVAHVLFTSSIYPETSINAAKQIPKVNEIFTIDDMQIQNPFLKICELQKAVKNRCNSL